MRSLRAGVAPGVALGAVLGAALAMGLAGCKGDGDAEQPPRAPDVTAALAAYDAPKGSLTADSAPELLEALVAEAKAFEQAAVLFTAFQDVIGGLGGSSETSGGQALRVRRQALSGAFTGWARIEYVCPGLDANVIDRGQGIIEAFGQLKGGKLDPLIWGEAKRCALPDADGRVLRFSADMLFETTRQLVAFGGSLTDADGITAPFGLDVLILEGGFSHRVSLPDGDVVLTWAGGTDFDHIDVEDRAGAWSCGVTLAPVGGTCSGPDGADVSF